MFLKKRDSNNCCKLQFEVYLWHQKWLKMFNYDNRNKKAVTKKIIEQLKQTNNIIISEQSAGRIEYLIKQRQFCIDSIDVDGNEVETGRPVQLHLDIKKFSYNICQ